MSRSSRETGRDEIAVEEIVAGIEFFLRFSPEPPPLTL